MRFSQLMKGVDISADIDMEIEGITCDSRRVAPGWAFVCIRGTNTDGHKYASRAKDAGAAIIIAEEDTGCEPQLIVDSTRSIWPVMCANWFGNPAKKLRLVGVTGTNGKTSTTYLLKALLQSCGHRVGLIGTIQNMIGERVLPSSHTTPDPYDLQSMFALMAAEGCSYAVMEVSSHALDQQRVSGLRFDCAVFTNLTQDHLDYHVTMQNYINAKKILFKQSNCAVINIDDQRAKEISDGLDCPVVTYSAYNDEADYTARNIRPRPDGVDFELVGTGQIGRVRLRLPGMFSVYNAMAAASCALSLGLPFDRVVDALGQVQGIKGRFEVVPTGRDFTVVIDYAHTPDGLEKICRAMKECSRGRLVTLFGCGGDRDRAKRPLMGKTAAELSDFLVITSDNPRSENPGDIINDILKGIPDNTPHIVIENRVDAIHWAIDNARPDDVILLAGKGHETYQILAGGCIHLDEREVVAQALEKLKEKSNG